MSAEGAAESLAELIARLGALPPDRAVEIVLPLVAEVAAVHARGVARAQITPARVLLGRNDEGAVVPTVVDVGVAQPESGEPGAAAGAVSGPYAAPEHAITTQVPEPSGDQYVLGLILYECVTGLRPAAGPITAPSSVAPEVPADLDAAVLRALKWRPGDRFESLAELGDALLPFASEKVAAVWRAKQAALAPAPPAPPVPAPPPVAPTPSPPIVAAPAGPPVAAPAEMGLPKVIPAPAPVARTALLPLPNFPGNAPAPARPSPPAPAVAASAAAAFGAGHTMALEDGAGPLGTMLGEDDESASAGEPGMNTRRLHDGSTGDSSERSLSDASVGDSSVGDSSSSDRSIGESSLGDANLSALSEHSIGEHSLGESVSLSAYDRRPPPVRSLGTFGIPGWALAVLGALVGFGAALLFLLLKGRL